MDFVFELEQMAKNAINMDETASEADIERWQKLFGLSVEDAEKRIQNYRSDYERQTISDELWWDVQESKVAQGYDREAYEYDLFCRPKKVDKNKSTTADDQSLRGMILDGPLDTPERVKAIARLAKTPKVTTAESEHGSKSFCYITAQEEDRIKKALVNRGIAFKPFFITINIAAKDLCAWSATPTLGLRDATLPQHRASDTTDLVQQNQYPVLYFFYGTLAVPEVLQRVLSIDGGIHLLPAKVFGGKITDWGGKYRALVDSYDDTCVDGYAFMVETEDQERELRLYETKMYEVVRCDIWVDGKPRKGLTFRFAG